MAILGLNYTKITAEKKGSAPNTEINTAPRILDVAESKLGGFGEKMDILSMHFSFESTYKPNVGKLSLEGILLFKPTDAKAREEIMKSWKKDKALPPKVHAEVINHLFRKVSLQALNLADLMQLPPVINMPKIRVEMPAEKKK